jgi:hypothetical protein
MFFVGFGTLEELVDEVQEAGVPVRVSSISMPGGSSEDGVIRSESHGIMVTARVGDEILYAWVRVGGVQYLGDTIASGKHVPARAKRAYQVIVRWLIDQGVQVRQGLYCWPEAMTLIKAGMHKDLIREALEESEA